MAHELAHVKNRDILTSSAATIIAATITFAARVVSTSAAVATIAVAGARSRRSR